MTKVEKEARGWRDQKRREWINGEFEDFGFIEKMQEMFPDE